MLDFTTSSPVSCPASSPTVTWRRVLLPVLAVCALALAAACNTSEDEVPTPPDARLVGTWRSTSDATFTDEWTLAADDAGTATRKRFDRDVPLAAGTPDTIDFRGRTYSRQTGTPSAFEGDFSVTVSPKTFLLQFTGSDYEHDVNASNASHRTEETGTVASGGSLATLTREDSGTVWTSEDQTKFELMTAGANRWFYSVIGGGTQLQMLHSSSWTLISGTTLATSSWGRLGVAPESDKFTLQFYSAGSGNGGTVTLSEWMEDVSNNLTYQIRRSYRWLDGGTYLAVNERIYGDYELQNSDTELVVYAERPLVQRRIVITSPGTPTTIITIGLADGSEPSFTNNSGTGILDGTFVNATTEYEFNDTARTYVVRESAAVVESGRYTISGDIVSFYREYRWYKQ